MIQDKESTPVINEKPIDIFKGFLNQVLDDYGVFLATLILGLIIGWYLKAFLADRSKNKWIDRLLDEKDIEIKRLSILVDRKLSKLQIQKEDKGFVQDLKNFFKNGKN